MSTYLEQLASGTVVDVDRATGRPIGPATPHPGLPDGCPQFDMVRSGHPEPDFPSDLWTEVRCGAPVFAIPGNPHGYRCINHHEYLGIEAESAIDGQVEFAASVVGRDLDAHEEARIREAMT